MYECRRGKKYNIAVQDLIDAKNFAQFMEKRPDFSGQWRISLAYQFGAELEKSGRGDILCLKLDPFACVKSIFSGLLSEVLRCLK